MEPTIDEIEKEAKNMLTKEEYEMLMKHYGVPPVLQVNMYFDTENKDLEKFNEEATLRVRDKKGVKVLELKLPEGDDTPEYKTILDLETEDALFKFGILPTGDVLLKLNQIGISGKFNYLGDLSTSRSEIESPGAKICLDPSTFPNGKMDYEIEVESDDFEYSKQTLFRIQEMFSIPTRKSKRKIQRFRENLN